MSFEGKHKIANGEQSKKRVLSPSLLDEPSHIKEESADDKNASVISTKTRMRDDQKAKKMAPGPKKRIVDGHKGSSSAATLLRNDKSGSSLDLPDSEEQIVKGKVSGSGLRKFSPDALKSDAKHTGVRKTKELLKSKSNFNDTNDVRDGMASSKGKTSCKRKKGEPGLGKPKLGTDEIVHPSKKSKFADMKNNVSKGYHVNDMKNKSPSSNKVNDKAAKQSDLKNSTSHVIALRAPTAVSPDVSGDEAALPLSKRRRRAFEAMSDSASLNSDGKMRKNPVELKNDTSSSSHVKIPTAQLSKRRRAVCLSDDDEDPKTPVHGGSIRTVKVPSVVSDASKSIDVNFSNAIDAQRSVRDSALYESSGPDEAASQLVNDFVSPLEPQTVETKPSTHSLVTPERSKSEQLFSKEAKPVLISPRKSPHLVSVTKQDVEQPRTTKATIKLSGNGTQKKAASGSVKGLGVASDGSKSSQNQVLSQRHRPSSSVDRLKSTPKAISRVNDTAFVTETSMEFDIFREDRSGSLIDFKTADSAMPMKHLIAAALAKRRQAHSQQYTLGNPSSGFVSRSDVHEASLSPAVHPFSSAINNAMQVDVQGFAHQTNLGSPSTLGCQSGSQNQQDTEEIEERRASSGHMGAGGSLSGGTEAAVARDAFEGMIETLSRTKESIGRATRLAIDCAKYGIANEVVELLIRKLESEPSFHRKVDLFFLVDSITQCSHNQKGIAGASYIPTVQSALPRLLGAAAPPGASARENRRQCLKVLRLWLERKILPESILRRYMDDIGVSNDETSSGFSLRRPSRAERAIDDPIREMEGMLDEYGSNATFQLPGFFSSNAFEDEEEEDLSNSPCGEVADRSPLEPAHALGELETCTGTPSDRRHCILEDVDGELEMEDVCGHPKDDQPLVRNDHLQMDLQQQGTNRIMEPASNSSNEFPPLTEGSPPLPPDSPPPPPPLPPSPPPPSPPSSPSPPPPPPPLPTQPPPLPMPHSCPPPAFIPLPPVPTQPSLLSQSVLPPPSAIQSSPQLAYQAPVHHEFRGTPNGNQIVQMAGNTPHGGHIDAAVKGELFPQQSPCFPTGVCNSREPSGYNSSRQLEYGHNEMYLNAQSSQPSQQFQPGNTAFVQRPLPPPQTSSSHFSFSKPAIPLHPQHPYPPQYSMPSQHDGRRPFVADEQWIMPAGEYNSDNQCGGWIAGRNPSAAGPLFVREGYFRPPGERPPSNNMGFPIASANNLPAGAPSSGHGVSQMLPCRPDMSAINCWRPA
ncbi:hypothetical protein DITRI_Ditri15bG0054800 [Diplodiscus trichospermus]